jgi:metal-responsive CopG/Arc/MetJ family transcriptional regulator
MINVKKAYGLGSSTISLVIPAELLMELNDLATRSGFTRNKLIKMAIEDLLNMEKRKEAKIDEDFVIAYNEHALNAHFDQ